MLDTHYPPEHAVRGEKDQQGYFLTFSDYPGLEVRVSSKEAASDVVVEQLSATTGQRPGSIRFTLDWDVDTDESWVAHPEQW
jgi:hypothetical protein